MSPANPPPKVMRQVSVDRPIAAFPFQILEDDHTSNQLVTMDTTNQFKFRTLAPAVCQPRPDPQYDSL